MSEQQLNGVVDLVWFRKWFSVNYLHFRFISFIKLVMLEMNQIVNTLSLPSPINPLYGNFYKVYSKKNIASDGMVRNRGVFTVKILWQHFHIYPHFLVLSHAFTLQLHDIHPFLCNIYSYLPRDICIIFTRQ